MSVHFSASQRSENQLCLASLGNTDGEQPTQQQCHRAGFRDSAHLHNRKRVLIGSTVRRHGERSKREGGRALGSREQLGAIRRQQADASIEVIDAHAAAACGIEEGWIGDSCGRAWERAGRVPDGERLAGEEVIGRRCAAQLPGGRVRYCITSGGNKRYGR